MKTELNRRTWLTAIMALPFLRWAKPKNPDYLKGHCVPSWIMKTRNGPCCKFGCDVIVERNRGSNKTIKAVPGTGDSVIEMFGGDHNFSPSIVIDGAGIACFEIKS